MSECECSKTADQITERSVLVALLAINGVMFGAEFILGIISDSTGLVADSLDMLADATVYGISLYAVGHAASVKKRAAELSGYFQIAIAGGVFLDIVRRFIFGSSPDFWFMLGVGGVVFAANLICLALIARHRKGEVHMRASWIFSKNDVITNLSVMIAGILVCLTGTRWPDLAIGIIISIVVLRGGFQILREAKL